MRHRPCSGFSRFFTVVSIGAAILIAPAAAQAQQPLDQMWLAGTIGDAKVRFYLESPLTPDFDTIYGVYYYERYGEPIVLTGLSAADGLVSLAECNGCEQPDGEHVLRLTIGTPDAPVVTGTWTSADGTRSLPVRLRRVAEFVKDDGARSLRRFADRRWPITFEYPAGWIVIATAQRLVVRPPDPEDMAWRNELQCTQGRGEPETFEREDGVVEIAGLFLRTSSGWRIDSGYGIGDATVRRYAAGTVVSGGVGYRGGTLWPLPGIYEEDRHLVLTGDGWVTCSDRLFFNHDGQLNLRPARSR